MAYVAILAQGIDLGQFKTPPAHNLCAAHAHIGSSKTCQVWIKTVIFHFGARSRPHGLTLMLPLACRVSATSTKICHILSHIFLCDLKFCTTFAGASCMIMPLAVNLAAGFLHELVLMPRMAANTLQIILLSPFAAAQHQR